MALSRNVVVELNEERESLLKRRQAIDERLAAIDLLLPRRALRRRRSRTRRTAAGPAEAGTLPLIEPAGNTPSTMRPAIRQVLRGRGFVKPSAVIEMLRSQGFTVTGKTPLAIRVYNELKRMLKEGELARDDEGRYALKAD